jgi:hypothetical protein
VVKRVRQSATKIEERADGILLPAKFAQRFGFRYALALNLLCWKEGLGRNLTPKTLRIPLR